MSGRYVAKVRRKSWVLGDERLDDIRCLEADASFGLKYCIYITEDKSSELEKKAPTSAA